MTNIAGKISDKKKVLDALDRNILRELQLNGRISLADLGRKLGRSRARIQQKLLKLEKAGVITGYLTRVDPKALGIPLTVIVYLPIDLSRVQQFSMAAKSRCDISEWYIAQDPTTTCILKAHTSSVARLEDLLDFLTPYGTPSVTLVLSSPVDFRAIGAVDSTT